jgi:hypothetical protein
VARLAKRAVLIFLAAVCFLYGADWLILQAKGSSGTGTVEVHPYLAVPQKNGKTEIITTDPEDVTCVHSMFPHDGHQPCWYLKGRTQKRIDM